MVARRLPDRRRGQPLARPPGRRAPAPRLLPHDVAVLHRARAPRRRAPLRRQEAARGRPRHRDHGRALDRRRPRRRTSTSRCASWTSGRAGAGRSRASPARRPTNSAPHRRALRRRSARRGAALPGPGRGDAAGGRARACASARASTRCRPAAMTVGGAVQHQRRTQRQAAGVDGRRAARGRRHLGEERAPVEAAALRRLDLRRQERGAVAARLRRDAPGKSAEARAAGQAGRAAAGADAARAGHDLQLRPRHRLRRGDGRRRGLRPLRVQPRVAGLPPAGLGLQADVLLAGARQRLRLHVAAERRAARRGRPDHRRGLDADQPQQHRRVPGDAGVRADLVEERPVGAAVQAGGRQGGREAGRGGSASPRRSSPTRRWRWARRARASTS